MTEDTMSEAALSESARASLNKHAADPVVLAPHDPVWAKQFQEISDQLSVACGDKLVTVHHIGSTSVPGLAAKPLIDMMPDLHRHDDGASLAAAP